MIKTTYHDNQQIVREKITKYLQNRYSWGNGVKYLSYIDKPKSQQIEYYFTYPYEKKPICIRLNYNMFSRFKEVRDLIDDRLEF